jgi:integrative and conjugative element protein (TIGR02256 family)
MTVGQRWETSSGEYAFLVKHEAWRRIESECKKAHGREIGGVLIGFYTEDKSTAVVTEASGPPPDSSRGRSWFWRGVAGLKDLLARRWAWKRRTYYLGEWHYHPALHVEPSGDDLVQMRYISQDSNYRCSKPIMIIVGKDYGEGRPIRAFVFPQGESHLEFHKPPNKTLQRKADRSR